MTQYVYLNFLSRTTKIEASMLKAWINQKHNVLGDHYESLHCYHDGDKKVKTLSTLYGRKQAKDLRKKCYMIDIH